MLKALVWKETRELAPLVALAVIAELLFYLPLNMFPLNMFVSINLNYDDGGRIPFVKTSLENWLLVVGGATGIALGFWQTAGELGRGTFLFLLHRPVDRTTVFTAKLAVGVALTLLVAGVPILGYALWAATPGTHASPFFWSMTIGTWLLWFRLPLFYLGAYLSGLRPGRWLGSRALPLFAAPLLFLMLSIVASWPLVSVALTLLVELAYLIAIYFVAQSRDYS